MKLKTCLLASVCLCTMAKADIVSTVGLTIVSPMPTVTANFVINDGLPHQIVFAEQQNVGLLNSLVTDTGIIPAGTSVDSWFFAVNAPSSQETVANTSIMFDTPVLGIVYQENASSGVPSPNFVSSNFLGAIGTTYILGNTCQFCAFENSNQTQILPDTASFNGNVASFHNDYSIPGDFARVIVEAPAPVPGPTVGSVGSIIRWIWR